MIEIIGPTPRTMKSVVNEPSFCAAQPCSTRRAKAPEDWRSLPQPRIRANLTGDPESFLEPAPSCAFKSLGRCSLWRSPMLSSAPVSQSPALRESAVLEPAPDTHLSAIVHRGRAGTTFPLTTALSPRRGRPIGRPRSIRASLLFAHLIHRRIPTAPRGRGLLGWSESGRGFSLSPRERVRVRGKRTDDGPRTFPSPKCVSGEGSTAAPLPGPTSTPEGRRPRRPRTHSAIPWVGDQDVPLLRLRLTRMRSRGTGAFSDVSGPRGAFWSAAVFCRSETLANDLATRLVGLRRSLANNSPNLKGDDREIRPATITRRCPVTRTRVKRFTNR